MARFEVLNSWFFPIPALRKDGRVVPAPKEAVEKYKALRDEWLKNHPKLPHEVPSVSLRPSEEPDKEGYLVKTEIMYK
ncbi:MAG: hypothetical protein Q8P89_02260 [bacterium]|nr:hypothetical protein [bacterium]